MFIGIDPGLTGAAAAVDQQGALLWVLDMPTRAKGGKVNREVCPIQLRELFAPHVAPGVHAVVERISARATDQGKILSIASLVHSAAIAEGVLAGMGCQVQTAEPLTWKRAMGLIGAGKAGALTQARKLFPAAPLDMGKHHNRAEALLLARFCWLQHVDPKTGMLRGRITGDSSAADSEVMGLPMGEPENATTAIVERSTAISALGREEVRQVQQKRGRTGRGEEDDLGVLVL